MDGSGKVELTGQLGDVMKESATAAISYIRANTALLGIKPDFYKTKDIHLHVPEGATFGWYHHCYGDSFGTHGQSCT